MEEKDEQRAGRSTSSLPRYHQLDVVRKLLADARRHGAGRALSDPALRRQRQEQLHRLAGASARRAWRRTSKPIFDSVIVVTDRRVLDKQIRDTIKQFAQVSATVGPSPSTRATCASSLQSGKKIIITTVQKFPFILDEIGRRAPRADVSPSSSTRRIPARAAGRRRR